nr:zinc finger, CCHC-type [Tanacetum cinerariifolium]
MAGEDAFYAFHHECGVCADYSHSRGWRGLILNAKYMAEDASSKKFLVSNFTNYKMTDSRPVLEQYNELLIILQRFRQHKMNMDESIQVSCIIDKLPSSWKDFKHTLKHLKEELTLIELSSHLRIKESLKVQDSDKSKGNNVTGPSVVNMVKHNNSYRYNDNKGKRKYHDTRANPNKKPKVTCWNYGKPGQLKKDCKASNIGNRANGSSTKGSEDGSSNPMKGRSIFNKSHQIYYVTYVSEAFFVQDDDVAWWVDSGATMHMSKDRCWFKSCDSLNDGSILYIGNELTALVHGRGGVDIRLNNVFDDIGLAFMSTSKLNDSIIWHARLGHVNFKNMQDMSKDELIPAIDMDTEKCERGIECIFVGYAEHSKAFRFYVIKLNDSVAINSIIESRDAIFDEQRFSSVPRPSQRSLVKGTEDPGHSVVSERVTDEIVQQSELRKSKRHSTLKDFDPEFQLYLIEGTMDEVLDQHSYCFNVEDDTKTFDEAMKSQDGFKQKSRIYYFDTYALMARISSVRLLIAMASIHNLIIHTMDANTTFLNGELEDEVYMNPPLGFIMSGNENKVCKLIESLYGLKQTPKQWHQKFVEGVLSNGYLLNQPDKCVYSKFDASGKGVIICLYVDDMLIFGTNQVQVDLTKEFLSSRFFIKDMGKADVILGIRIKHESNGIAISQSHYIKKVLKKFNYSDCTPVSTPLDTCKKPMPNKGLAVSQLEHSRVIGCLMYAITYTRPDIAFVVGKLSRLPRSYITGSIIESEFVTLAAAGKEAEWLKNMLLEIPLWVKPIAHISIRCDSAATLAKAYSQMYNGKSRHLGVIHSMIHELITNVVVSIEFVTSQQNLVDHLMKGLARDLVIKSAEGMRLKSI